MNLYKYLPQKYADALITRGSLRLGTLFDFRQTEHKNGISDATEGKKYVNLSITKKETYSSNTGVPDALQNFLRIEGDCENISVNNIHTRTAHSSKDLYIFCLSYENSKEVMNELEGTEACLLLKYPNEFFRDLSRIIDASGVLFEGVHRCEYRSREYDLTSGKDSIGVHAALIKEPQFKGQKEIRAIWRSTKDEIHPMTINHSHLGQYFEMINA